MYLKEVKYKDGWLAPGSRALELLEAKKPKELEKHMAEVEANYKKLIGESK